ncbi:MAG: hypothetical protein H6732_18595 [Alphaproteobacteria bacterium]|nr:hypothetical protein [Alphaproteobacteria bacterium]
MPAVDLEPWSPRALFLVAHHATWAGAYFQRVIRAASLASHPDAQVAAYRARLVAALREEQAYAASLVRTADQLARAHGLDVPPAPALPDAWQAWVTGILRGFRQHLDLAVPTNAALAFGFEQGQVRATLAVLVTLTEMQRHGLDVTAELVAGLRAVGGLAQSWTASASLLARAPDTEELVASWGPVHGSLATLAQADVGHLDAVGAAALARETTGLLQALGELEQVALTTLPAET